ncbi:MAG: cytochrome c biogenesis CcdA family protein [Actinomycetia bacterium]|nr:cytochrome c biogenesis CcdA family protein [Actinomycetes bacterium]
MNLSLSFIRGLIASINPCGFVLLPTYLMYFLGISANDPQAQRAPISRALTVGALVSAGFFAVFFVIGAATQYWTYALFDNAKYATLVIGLLFVVLGIAILFGFKLPITTPRIDIGERNRTLRTMFLYGIAYAVASIGCTLPLFIGTLFQTGERKGYWAGVANVVMYAAGMALVVISLTLALAVANQGFVRWLREKMQYVEMVSGAFVLLSGLYLLWYYWKRDVQGTGDPLTDAVENLQQDVQAWLNDNWQLAAWVLGGVVALGVAYALIRERTKRQPTE